MSRRQMERRKYREALVPGLVLSAVAHALVLGMATFGVSLPEDTDDAAEDRAERWEENSVQLVSVRPRSAPSAEARSAAGARANDDAAAEADAAAVAAPRVRAAASAPVVATERVDAPLVAVRIRGERRQEGRLSATQLAGMFPGGDQMPRPTSRAAREASGEHRDVGDRFRALGGTQRAGPSGGGCTVAPGAIIDRRFPQGITIGGS